MNKKVLLISTSSDNMKGHPTGLWLAEPYNIFKKAGFDIEIASIKGGEVPLDKVSIPDGVPNEYAHIMPLLKNTKSLSSVLETSFDAILFAGGHGPLIDFTNDSSVEKIILDTYNKGNVVAGVCHGLTAFVNVKNEDGSFFVDGKKLTVFSNGEEDLAQLSHLVPYAIETELKKQGAIIELAAAFTEKVVIDKNFITGQNPQSSHAIANAIVKNLA